jgi:hypothetical protein
MQEIKDIVDGDAPHAQDTAAGCATISATIKPPSVPPSVPPSCHHQATIKPPSLRTV